MNIPINRQIQAVLSRKTNELIRSNITKGASLSDYKFSDVITVNPDDIFNWVAQNEFPPDIVASEEKEDRLCLVRGDDNLWSVFYYERGNKCHEKVFVSKTEAIKNIIQRIYISEKLHQNSLYKSAHPELVLPSPLLID